MTFNFQSDISFCLSIDWHALLRFYIYWEIYGEGEHYRNASPFVACFHSRRNVAYSSLPKSRL